MKLMICELCKTEHDGSYGSGRFCSSFCAHSFTTKSKRSEINEKVSKKLKGRKSTLALYRTKEQIDKWRSKIQNTLRTKQLSLKIRQGSDVIDITRGELARYRELHKVCEICGKPETRFSRKDGVTPNNLSVDHDHATLKFRGLLCQNCNSRLGWYENHKEIIDKYLKRVRVAELADAEDLKPLEDKTSV